MADITGDLWQMLHLSKTFTLFYFILFYFILFYFILFYFILFYFILFYFILWNHIEVCFLKKKFFLFFLCENSKDELNFLWS